MGAPSNRTLVMMAVICALGAGLLFGRTYLANTKTKVTAKSVPPVTGLEKYSAISIERTTADSEGVETEQTPSFTSDSTKTTSNRDFSTDVSWFLGSENSDMAKVIQKGDQRNIDRAKLAAIELTNKLVPCLAKKTKCPYYPKDNQEYYYMGGAPVYHALERAFDFFEMAENSGQRLSLEISNQIFSQAMRLPHTGISFKAASLLLLNSTTTSEKVNSLKSAEVLGPVARVMFLQFASGLKSERSTPEFTAAFNQAVQDSVGSRSDAFTRSETVKKLDQLDLDEETFKVVARTSCREAASENARLTVGEVLQRKARASGFELSAAELCSG